MDTRDFGVALDESGKKRIEIFIDFRNIPVMSIVPKFNCQLDLDVRLIKTLIRMLEETLEWIERKPMR